MKGLLSAFLIVSLAVFLASCKSDSVNIEGDWKLSGDTLHEPFNFVEKIEFKADGTVVTDSNSFPYTDYEVKQNNDGENTIVFKGNHSNQTYVLNEAENDPKKLYITNSKHTDEYKDMVLLKQ